MDTVFAVFREISDQSGLEKLVGVYSTKAKADTISANIRASRSYVQEWRLDQPPVPFGPTWNYTR